MKARKLLTVFFMSGIVFGLWPSPTASASAVRGYLSHRISGCDYFLVKANDEYDLLEWYGGYDPDKGDVMVGDNESYGFHDVYDSTAEESVHIYTEDYQLSRSDALEKLADACE